jgi:hypothetical protein
MAMFIKLRLSIVAVIAVLAGMLAVVPAQEAVAAPAARGSNVIYDSTVTPRPGNLPSVGAEAYSFTEFGDEVSFAAGSRQLQRVTVTLSSWGCEAGHWYTSDCVTSPGAKFAIPITFNVYSPGANNTAGALLGSRTQTFQVPYRPSSDNVRCTGGRWFDGPQGCFNGLAANITFNFSSQQLALPDTAVFGITYNTSHYGPHPIGQSPACYSSSAGCPYDSLNIGLAPVVKVGSKPFPNTVYQNAVFAGDYCDNGLAGVGTMRLDSPTVACWAGYVPAVKFVASGDNNDGNGNSGDNNGDGGDSGGA